MMDTSEYGMLQVVEHDFRELKENNNAVECMFKVLWENDTSTWECLENIRHAGKTMIRNLLLQTCNNIRRQGIPKRVLQKWTSARERLHYIPQPSFLLLSPKAKIIYDEKDDNGVEVYLVRFDRQMCFPVFIRKSVMEYLYPLVVIRYCERKRIAQMSRG